MNENEHRDELIQPNKRELSEVLRDLKEINELLAMEKDKKLHGSAGIVDCVRYAELQKKWGIGKFIKF